MMGILQRERETVEGEEEGEQEDITEGLDQLDLEALSPPHPSPLPTPASPRFAPVRPPPPP
jgi:hypothetical protein